MPQSHCGESREDTLFTWLHICYAHHASLRFEQSICRGSLMTICMILLSALFGSLAAAVCKHTSCAQVHELPQSHCGASEEDTLFSWLHIYYSHLAFVIFERSRCCRSLMAIYIMLFAWVVELFLVHWCQRFVNVHHVPKWMSRQKAIVVITRRTEYFHDYIYIMLF